VELERLLAEEGRLFSEELGIDVAREPFKWFLASMLFGARISVDVARRTYRAYEEEGLTYPDRIVAASRFKLISLHGRGGYARYDNITADYVKEAAERLVREYEGDIRRLNEESGSPRDLEERLLRFRGVGPVTVKIFLRELRGVWRNADPDLTEVEAAHSLGILRGEGRPIDELKRFWKERRVAGYDLRHLEAALVRLGLRLRRRRRRRGT